MQPTTEGSSALIAHPALLGALTLLLAACGGTASGTGGTVLADGGLPPDAGLKPGASIESCRTAEGARICGSSVTCYEQGDDCECVGSKAGDRFAGMSTNAEVGMCGGGFEAWHDGYRRCGYCSDGEVCMWWPGMTGPIAPCVSEATARIAWLNGAGGFFLYADGAPYTGDPIPSAATCPLPDGDLELCGGDCGGCSKPGFFCTGRSPVHPLGICTTSGRNCDGVAGASLLTISVSPPGALAVAAQVCARDCSRLASTVPGGAKCIAP
jgi:hypothetical protein